MNVVTRLREFAERAGLLKPKSKARARLQEALKGTRIPIAERSISENGESLRVYESAFRPAPLQTAVAPSEAELHALNEKAAAVNGFLLAFIGRDPGDEWSLPDLDAAFANWLTAEDKKYYSKTTVIAITGAGFGNYLVKHLGMRWLWISDSEGSAWAVRDSNDCVTGFPHHTVAKRIDDLETSFFEAVFLYLRSEVNRGPHVVA